jgi:hypothetical protein
MTAFTMRSQTITDSFPRMPTIDHEAPLELFRNRPQLAPELLQAVFGIKVPDHDQVSLGSETYAEGDPAELRCDATILLGDPGAPLLGIVIESQLRPSTPKTFSWPAYLALLRARRKCPVILLVLCPDEATARACARPIELGHPDWNLRPLAMWPGRAPAVTDPAEARRLPELSVLSAPAHADGPDGTRVLAALCSVFDHLDRDQGRLYYDYVLSRLSGAARTLLEEIMKTDTYTWQSDFALEHIALGKAEGIAEGKAEGKAEGEARSVLMVLAARGITVPDDLCQRITSCTDLNQLDTWVQRAATITTAEQLLD